MSKYPENYLVNLQQQTAEWLQERCGSVTGSRIGAVVKKLKRGGYSAERETYKMELLTEILTGRATQHYVTAEMQFGIENEPLARTAYEMAMGVEVQRIGYIRHPRIPRAGVSPDGLVGDDGLLEIKVPNTSTHLEYVLADTGPEEYVPQMAWQLCCSGREYVDFCSYDPRLPQEFGLCIKRMHRNDALLSEMEKEVEKFRAELEEIVQRLLKGRDIPLRDPAECAEEYTQVTGVPKAVIYQP